MDTALQTKVLDVIDEIQGQFISRDTEIETMVLGILAKQHCLLLGPPGTAKTQIAHAISSAFQTTFFRRLITQYSTPDEIIGPVDLFQYKEKGIFRRILEGKAADSQIVLLDEVFKGGPAILNSLLSLMEERILDNDGAVHHAPLISMLGASNELPNKEDGLDAFHDRFNIRLLFTYLNDVDDFKAMLRLNSPITSKVITAEELAMIHQEINQLTLSPAAVDSLAILWEGIQEEEVSVSDRRFKAGIQLMAAHSWTTVASSIMPSSIEVMEHVLWSKPEEINPIRRLVLTSVNPGKIKSEEIFTKRYFLS